MEKWKSIRVDSETWRRLKQASLDRGLSVGAIVAGFASGLSGEKIVVERGAFARAHGIPERRYERDDYSQ